MQQQYVSGMGKQSSLPPELKRWNWGAFFLNWIWGIGNSTYIAFLMFVPFVNIIMIFILGAKGNEWAWQNRVWRDIQHFRKTQRQWAIAGVISWIVVIGAVVSMFTFLLKGEVYEKSLAEIRSHGQVIELLGSPIEPGLFVAGSVKVSGPDGAASIQYSLSGPKGAANAYVRATRELGQWTIRDIVVRSDDNSRTIQVLKNWP